MVAHNQETNLTDEFSSSKHLVLRRGFQFQFIVELKSLSDVKVDDVTVEFHRGYRARYSRGTKFQGVCTKKSRRDYQWEMKVINTGSDKVRYGIEVPCDAPIGSYKLYVRVPTGKSKSDSVWESQQEIVILFNPWNKEDDVYMPEEEKRSEYILNETGLIWAGTYRSTFTWPWNFAQFETVSLEAVLYMMDLWNLGSDARRSPVNVARCLAEMVNRNDNDGGILEGLWSANDDDYKDGTDPTSWSGSEAILQQFVDTKKPVKYAQCWVFGGTLTTTLRTVGIPARPITNFQSAHDSDFSRSIDYYYDKNNKMVSELSSDSVWNYHVWVEAWMTRPDLSGHHGGWQAMDATPQELSPHSRSMVVGPASIQAIKDGLDLKYDNEFVISEVNADIKYYYESKNGDYIVMSTDKRRVGTHISTKAVGKNERQDITLEYKYPEGSAAERAALHRGKEEDDMKPQVLQFDVSLTSGEKIGDDLVFEVTTKTTENTRVNNLNITCVIEQVMYTGVVGKEIKRQTQTFNGFLSAGSTHTNQFQLPSKDYLNGLGDQSTLLGTFLVYAADPEISWIEKFPVRLEVPDVVINIDDKGDKVQLKGGRMVNAVASFKNPLKKPLTDVKFFIEGSGLLLPTVKNVMNVPIGGKATVSFPITPRSVSPHPARNKATLIITAQTKQLKGMMGTASVTII